MIIASISAFMLLYGIVIFTVFITSSTESNSTLKPIEFSKSHKNIKKYIYFFIDLVTPIILVASSALLFLNSELGLKFSLFSLLALLYYCLKRFQWEGLSKENAIMGAFILIGFFGSSISMVFIMLNIF